MIDRTGLTSGVLLDKLLLTPEETAKVLGIGRSKMYQMIAAEEVPVLRLGKLIRISTKMLKAWIDQSGDQRVKTL